jgi:tetratricopeptide (TPR) repeat protein
MQLFYAFLLSTTGSPQRALDFLNREVPAERLNTIEFLEQLASLYEGMGRYREALVAYQKGLGLEPKNPGFLCGAARMYGRLGRLAEMNATLAKIDVDATPSALMDAARVYLDLERYRDAEALIRRYIRTNPKAGSMAWRTLGDALLPAGDPRRAKQAYKMALAEALRTQP